MYLPERRFLKRDTTQGYPQHNPASGDGEVRLSGEFVEACSWQTILKIYKIANG